MVKFGYGFLISFFFTHLNVLAMDNISKDIIGGYAGDYAEAKYTETFCPEKKEETSRWYCEGYTGDLTKRTVNVTTQELVGTGLLLGGSYLAKKAYDYYYSEEKEEKRDIKKKEKPCTDLVPVGACLDKPND